MSALNVIGVIAYVLSSTQGWVEPEAANIPGAAGGGALLWGMTALPTLLAFIVIDVLWLIFESVVCLTRRKGRLGLVYLVIPVVVIPLMWAIAIYIDFSHHGVP